MKSKTSIKPTNGTQKLSWRKLNKSKRGAREEKLLSQHFQKKAAEEANTNEIEDTETPEPECTWTIAIPGSILDNAQSRELRTYLAGQIARSAAIYKVDEIVIFDELCQIKQSLVRAVNQGQYDQSGDRPDCNVHLSRILQYLECPQYLRKAIFPLHKDFQFAGLLNPLDCPHHFRSDEVHCPFREAVVLNKPVKTGHGSICDAGISKDVRIDRHLVPGVRVTLELNKSTLDKKRVDGRVVSPLVARSGSGLYWGYNVRLAGSLKSVFTQCPYDGGYDCTIGTSDKGQPASTVEFPRSRHYLLVLGGLKGLESCMENDELITEDNPEDVFNFYVNTCPEQGSRTIRTEEALLISLSVLQNCVHGKSVVE